MKIDITDGRALSALSPTALTAYLCARGWSAVESDAAFAVFERAGDSNGIGLDVPLRAASRDYARRVAELLQNLELLEGRSQLEITPTRSRRSSRRSTCGVNAGWRRPVWPPARTSGKESSSSMAMGTRN